MAPDPIPDDVLSACAAGELAPADAEAIRARAETDPALARRLAAADRVERALCEDELLPVPLALLGAVIERVRSEPSLGVDGASTAPARGRASAAVRWGGAAAATLLVSFGLWAATSGFEPAAVLGLPTAAEHASLPERLGAALEAQSGRASSVTDAWAALAPDLASTPGPSLLWIAGGLALLASAAVLGRRFRPLFEAATAPPRTA